MKSGWASSTYERHALKPSGQQADSAVFRLPTPRAAAVFSLRTTVLDGFAWLFPARLETSLGPRYAGRSRDSATDFGTHLKARFDRSNARYLCRSLPSLDAHHCRLCAVHARG